MIYYTNERSQPLGRSFFDMCASYSRIQQYTVQLLCSKDSHTYFTETVW